MDEQCEHMLEILKKISRNQRYSILNSILKIMNDNTIGRLTFLCTEWVHQNCLWFSKAVALVSTIKILNYYNYHTRNKIIGMKYPKVFK